MQKLSAAALVPFEERISSFYNKHKEHIYLFLFLLAVNVFIYGQRLVGFIFAAEDMLRLMREGPDYQLIVTKRWFNSFTGSTIFGGERHILLFFNAALGVFSITLAGFITAFLFEAKRKTHMAVITLLCSTAPAWAFQLYYSTNTIALVSTAWGVFGIYALYRYGVGGKIFGFVLIVFAVGAYQSIIIVGVAVTCVKTLLRIMKAQKRKEIIFSLLHAFCAVLTLVLAYIVSNSINAITLFFLSVAPDTLNYMTVKPPASIAAFFSSLAQIAINALSVHTFFYERAYQIAWFVLGLCSLAGGLAFLRSVRGVALSLWVWKIIALILFFPALIVVKELLNLVGLQAPYQAQYAMGWIAAGLWIISLLYHNGVIGKLACNIGVLAAAALLVLNIFTINVFFSLMQRYTQVDVIRANEIVSRIRSHKNYPGEEKPLRLMVLGIPPMVRHIQYFSSIFNATSIPSAYNLFKQYTDLNFTRMSTEDFSRVQAGMRARADEIKAYPRPGFVYIDGIDVVLFLDGQAALESRLDAIYKTKNNYPAIASAGGFDLFVSGNAICYVNPKPNEQAQSDQTFFHIVPENAADLYSKEAKQKGFAGLTDFSFGVPENQRIGINNETLLFACKELPNYPIAMIRTGQYKPVGGMQKVRFILGEINKRRKESGGLQDFVASLKQLVAEVKTSALQYPWQRWSVTISGEELRRAQEARQSQ